MPTRNRAKPSFVTNWPFTGLILASVALLIFCFVLVIRGHEDGNYVSSMVLTTRYSLEQMKDFASKSSANLEYSPALYDRWSVPFNRMIRNAADRFNVDGNDVLVFLHVQKTAGTSFEKFLVNHLDIKRPCLCRDEKSCGNDKSCRRKCKCFRPKTDNEVWLFSRYSTGWMCGLHADFTELYVSRCVEKAMDKVEGQHRQRRYFYTTFLRSPVERFISEYRHVERGATWGRSRHICNGRPPLPDELPWCYDPNVGWSNVSLDEFLACPYNLAFNRQTRMLADLTLVHCYDERRMPIEKRESLMLESAKNTLRSMAFFGIQDRMAESQELFSKSFGLRFVNDLSVWNKSKSDDTIILDSQLSFIRARNNLDVELFKYATKLFEKRLSVVRGANTVGYSDNDTAY